MLVEQIMTIPVDFLDKCIGKVSDNKTLSDISNAIAVQFPILQMVNAWFIG